MDGKECKTCRKWKPFSDFYVRADSADGYGRMCRACKSAFNNAHYRAKQSGTARLAEPEPTGWPLAAEAEESVKDLHRHMRARYGAQPGAVRGAI